MRVLEEQLRQLVDLGNKAKDCTIMLFFVCDPVCIFWGSVTLRCDSAKTLDVMHLVVFVAVLPFISTLAVFVCPPVRRIFVFIVCFFFPRFSCCRLFSLVHVSTSSHCCVSVCVCVV